MSDEEKRQRGNRVRELRLALGFKTQEALADAAGEGIERTYVNRVERGGNALTSVGLQRALAYAMKLRVEDFADYLDGRIPLEELVQRRNTAVYYGASELSAFELVSAVDELPGLRKWLEENPKELTPNELATGVAAYRRTRPSSRLGDRAPAAGWGVFFRDVLSGAQEHTEGDATDVDRLAAKQIGRRPKLRPKSRGST